jgi:hypothetical protein
MKKTSLVLASMMFAGVAVASQEQPAWEFGCKFDAQKPAAQQQAKVEVKEVKATQENTWTFEVRELPVVSMR